MKSQDYLAPILLALSLFMSAGWYFAEADNEILLMELEAQKSTQFVHHHDYKQKGK